MGGAISNLTNAASGGKKKPTYSASATAPATGAARGMDEEAEAVVETDSGVLGVKKKGKKALVTQTAAANVGGEGGSGLNIPVA